MLRATRVLLAAAAVGGASNPVNIVTWDPSTNSSSSGTVLASPANAGLREIFTLAATRPAGRGSATSNTPAAQATPPPPAWVPASQASSAQQDAVQQGSTDAPHGEDTTATQPHGGHQGSTARTPQPSPTEQRSWLDDHTCQAGQIQHRPSHACKPDQHTDNYGEAPTTTTTTTYETPLDATQPRQRPHVTDDDATGALAQSTADDAETWRGKRHSNSTPSTREPTTFGTDDAPIAVDRHADDAWVQAATMSPQHPYHTPPFPPSATMTTTASASAPTAAHTPADGRASPGPAPAHIVQQHDQAHQTAPSSSWAPRTGAAQNILPPPTPAPTPPRTGRVAAHRPTREPSTTHALDPSSDIAGSTPPSTTGPTHTITGPIQPTSRTAVANATRHGGARQVAAGVGHVP